MLTASKSMRMAQKNGQWFEKRTRREALSRDVVTGGRDGVVMAVKSRRPVVTAEPAGCKQIGVLN